MGWLWLIFKSYLIKNGEILYLNKRTDYKKLSNNSIVRKKGILILMISNYFSITNPWKTKMWFGELSISQGLEITLHRLTPLQMIMPSTCQHYQEELYLLLKSFTSSSPSSPTPLSNRCISISTNFYPLWKLMTPSSNR
jgi:hypothetical protein